jgi:hypothetical protein
MNEKMGRSRQKKAAEVAPKLDIRGRGKEEPGWAG